MSAASAEKHHPSCELERSISLPCFSNNARLVRTLSWPWSISSTSASAPLSWSGSQPARSQFNSIDGSSAEKWYKDQSTSSTEGSLRMPISPEEQEKSSAELNEWQPIPDPVDTARSLTPTQIRWQKSAFCALVLSINITCALVAIFAHSGIFVFVFILFIKAKDFLSVLITILGLIYRRIRTCVRAPPVITPKWILTLIPAYSESGEQIIKAIYSLRDNDVEPHLQVMCVLLDGKPRDIRSQMTRVLRTWQRPYVTLKAKRGMLNLVAGFMEDVPVLVIEKVKNAGKKDSLVLCHDLFNMPRKNLPLYTKLLRDELWTEILPLLTSGHDFHGFDMIFCTDADSTIHKGALLRLANAIAEDKDVIAACGLVLVELEPGFEWSVWNLYQQFQYTFGQYVRRRAEDIVGKVTCLPGCITMIAVRPEMAGAIRKYAEPVTGFPVIAHQVQYLGTDRRLTYSMLSQGKKLKTRFVPNAVSETVAPQSLQHYLSQRRRWGSNSYFNNYYYCFGEQMIIVTRIAASMEILRLSMVYYRVFNTALFIKGLIKSFDFMKLLPLLIISQTPTIWFIFSTFVLERELRKRSHKLMLGFCVNKLVSPLMSVVVFTKVATNLGSQVWGMSGITAAAAPAAPAAPVTPSALEAQPLPPGEVL